MLFFYMLSLSYLSLQAARIDIRNGKVMEMTINVLMYGCSSMKQIKREIPLVRRYLSLSS